MKKYILLLVTASLTSFFSNAQENKHNSSAQLSNYAFVGSNPALENGIRLYIGSPRIMQQEKNEKDFIQNIIGNTKTKTRTFSYVDWINTDSAGAAFYLANITSENKGQYEYRILENNSKLIKPWTTITNYIPDFLDQNNKNQMSDLGIYKTTWGNFINIEIRQKGKSLFLNGDTVLAITGAVLWLQIKPVIRKIYGDDEIKTLFSTVLNNQDLYGQETKRSEIKLRWFYPGNHLDTIPGNIKKLILNDSAENLIFSLEQTHILRKEMIEYKLTTNTNTIIDWKANDFDNNFIWLKRLYPATYKLQIRFSSQRHNVTDYEFEIKSPPKHQTTSFKIITGSLIVAFFGFIILFFRLIFQKNKLKTERQKKEKTESELKALRAQLNPHFIFNSLSSIQGLINKNEIDNANKYLSDFASLMRTILDSSGKDNNNFSVEIKTLNDYLQLEQLRFHFQYQINIDNTINKSTIEIPSLLLQPIVENAVKHGVSYLQEKGKIDININQKNNDLLVDIIDNGKGFDTSEKNNGYGLKLTKERIALVNGMSKTQSIEMNTQSDKGTAVHLIFKKWMG